MQGPVTDDQKAAVARWEGLEQVLQEAGFPSPPQEISVPDRLERMGDTPPVGGDHEEQPTP
jgi:hypothetical protein